MRRAAGSLQSVIDPRAEHWKAGMYSMKLMRAAAGLLLSAGLLLPGIAAGPALAAPQSATSLPAGAKEACPDSTTAGTMSCALVDTAAGDSINGQSTNPDGLGPGDLQGAYDLQGATLGQDQTVAIVEAGADPTAAADLAVYRSQYGMAACTTGDGCLSIENENGGSSLPTATIGGWPDETAFDLDVVSAICPNCHLLLLEADSQSIADLSTAANTAAGTPGVHVVDNTYAGTEFENETTYDANYDHPGVAMVAAAGNDGYTGTVNYPAASPDVTAVSGTVVSYDSSTGLYQDTGAWASDTTGCSAYESAPSWQGDTGCGGRAVADIAAAAAVSVNGVINPLDIAYYSTTGSDGWTDGGGTGAAADIIAGAYALAGTPPSGSSPASFPYTNPGGSYTTPGNAYPYDTGLNDITSGSTGTCTLTDMCNAAPGYDGPTGVGTPSSILSLTSRTVTGVAYSNIIPSLGAPSGDGQGPDFCLDNKQSTLANANPIDIWTCNGNTDSQQWTFGTDGTVQIGGYCLGVSNGGTANGTAAILFTCDGHTSQDWSSMANGQLVNENSSKCLYDPVAPGSGTPAAGDELEIDTCGTASTASQGFGWYLPVRVVTGSGPITIQSSGECLDNGYNSGLGTSPAACDGSAAQNWSVTATGAIENGGACISQEEVVDADGGSTKIVGMDLGTSTCSNDIEPAGPLTTLASGVLKDEVDGSCIAYQSDVGDFAWQTSDCTRLTLP